MKRQPGNRATGRTAPPRFRALILLNVALLGLLAAVTFSPGADAQARVRGDYVMVSGHMSGAEGHCVFITDVVNQEMIALTFDQNSKDVIGVGYRNLAADAANLLRR